MFSSMWNKFTKAVEKALLNVHKITFHNTYEVWCVGPDGKEKWREVVPNIVVNAGLNDVLDKYFKGSGYTAAWYVGLSDGTPSFAAGDTLASHAGWAEVTDYTGDRQALTLGSVSSQSVNNSGSPASFPITDTVTVGGAFLSTVATGTSGTLYGGAAFTGGDRSAVNGDTINVTVTLTAATA